MSPTISTKKTTPSRKGPLSQAAMDREKKLFLIISAVLGATLVIHLIVQIVLAVLAGSANKKEYNAVVAAHEMWLTEDEEKFQDQLQIAMNAQKDNLAAKNRAAEYRRRQAYEPEFAKSVHEKNMLKMMEISGDSSLSPEEALKKIAQLASPGRSGVAVKASKGSYQVEVAYPIRDVMRANQQEFGSYMPGQCHGLRNATASIMRDIFAFGGILGVSEVLVHGQDVSVIKEGRKERKEIRDWLVYSGTRGAADWSSIGLEDVDRVWRKKKDNCR